MCCSEVERIVTERVEATINDGTVKLPENINWETFNESIRRLCRSLPRNTKGGVSKQADLVYRLLIIPWFENGCNTVPN